MARLSIIHAGDLPRGVTEKSADQVGHSGARLSIHHGDHERGSFRHTF
jgi:hypothetical protein